MARCDELESLQARQSQARAQALRVSLARLLDAPDATTSGARWSSLSAHWHELLDTPASVAPLRQTILGLAVRGQLVPQDQADEPTSHLLKQIAAEKARLVAEKKIKQSAPLPPVKADEMPFDLPKSWAWVRLGELGEFTGGGTPSKSNPDYWNGDVPWVSPKDMKVPIIEDSQDHISMKAVENSSVKIIKSPALLFVLRGMILAHSFPIAVTNTDVTINQDMKALRICDETLMPHLSLCFGGLKQEV